MAVVRIVVGDVDPATPVEVGGVDLPVASVPARIGYLLAGRRVGRLPVAFLVVGDSDDAPPSGLME